MGTIGVLALQGDFPKHIEKLKSLKVQTAEIRTSEELQNISALIIPGGESTTLTKLITAEFRKSLTHFCQNHPVWGTCAGMIMLSKKVDDKRVNPLGFVDIEIDRNGYGRQVHSFEAEINLSEDMENHSKALHGIFIRAPRVKSYNPSVKPLAWLGDEAVCLRQNNFLVSSFHPELCDDDRLHRYFFKMIA